MRASANQSQVQIKAIHEKNCPNSIRYAPLKILVHPLHGFWIQKDSSPCLTVREHPWNIRSSPRTEEREVGFARAGFEPSLCQGL